MLFGRHCCSGTQGFSVREQHLEWKAGTWWKVNFISYHVLTGLSRSFQNFKNSLERSERRFYLKAPLAAFSSILGEGTKNALLFVVHCNGAPDHHWDCNGHWFADRQVHAWCHQFCGTLCSRVSCHRCAEGFCKISNVWRCNLGNDTQLNGYLSYLYWMSMIMCIRCHWWIMINEHKYVVVQYLVLIIRTDTFSMIYEFYHFWALRDLKGMVHDVFLFEVEKSKCKWTWVTCIGHVDIYRILSL